MGNDQKSRRRREKKKRQHELQRKRKRKQAATGATGAVGGRRREATVGFTARCGMNMLCDQQQCCVVVHSRAAMKQFMENHGLPLSDYVIESACSDRILRAMSLGGRYALDQQSYGRLLPIANAEGRDWQPFENRKPTDQGIYLVQLGVH